MNKQQLASKIWDSANKMRSKIEANEYKDYILGFMFYKFLSDKEQAFLEAKDFSQADIEALTEEDPETVEFIKDGIGYFIAYDNLFSTWLKKGNDFNVANVRDALSAFSRLISPSHKKVFDGIVSPEVLKRVPTGFSPDSPAAEWLKYKHFIVEHPLTEAELVSSDFREKALDVFRAMKPFNDFCNESLER